MTNNYKTEQLAQDIEKLAMAITHSEQGHYDKNENYVKIILLKHDLALLEAFKKDVGEMIEKIKKPLGKRKYLKRLKK